ncbi:MAG: hypothetical protein HFG99_12730 [Dorea sp.]|jgi:hypothetical protein|nr:hypothetical protein [Dorea sp.]MCI9249971.1 hypothetical protein [Dorea sp.]
MKAMLRKSSLLVLVFAMALGMLAGCGMKPEDAKAYVQATLDAGYKEDFGEYTKITESTKEEAQKLFDSNIDTVTNSLGLSQFGVSEEMTEKYRELLKETFSKAKYTVGDVKETDGGFEVKVSAEPMQMFVGLEDALIGELEKKVKESKEDLDEAAITQLTVDILYDILSQRLAEVTYGDAQEVTVHVTKNSDGVWNITEADLQALDSALFSI